MRGKTSSAAAGCRAMCSISVSTTARSCTDHEPATAGGVTSARRASPIAASSSSLFATCQYSAIGVTPNSCAMRRMVIASGPSVSITVRARSTIAALLSSTFGRVAVAVRGVMTRTIHHKA